MSTTATARPGCIFLSHSGADTHAAHELAEILRRSGLEVWFDKDDLQPGEPWMAAIEENIQRASAMLVYVGRLGIQSWVDREVRLGLVRNTQAPGAFRIIPVLGEGAEPSLLPPFLAQHQWTDLRNSQEAPQQIQRLLQILAGSSPQRAIPSEYWATHSPFRGLQEFKPEDAWLFFGRDAETQDLLTRLGRGSVLIVAGNSGSGKSSLIRAGLLPALKRGRFFCNNKFVESWHVAILRPSQAPFDNLADVLPGQLAPYLSATERDQFIGHLRTTLPQNTDALRNAIATLNDLSRDNVHVLLVVDQFEELFTLVSDRNIQAKYVQLLMAASRSAGVHLLLSLRADFYSHCLEHKELSQCLETSLYNVPRMEVEQLRETIETRLALAGARAETGLIDTLLSDIGNEPGDLALLEHALDQLWSKLSSEHTLSNQAYVEMGRLRGALGRHADQVCRQLGGSSEQNLVQKIFLELVQFGEGAQDTRRRISKETLLSLGPSEHIEQILNHLASSRLIQTGNEDGQDFAEVSHEALIREWPTLRQWLLENREDLRLERRITERADEWYKLNRDPEALLQGVALAQAEEWLQKHSETRGPLLEFVEASVALRIEAQEQRLRSAARFRWLSFFLAVLLLVIGVLAIHANTEKHDAKVALARSAVQDGIRLFEQDRPDQALAYFALALRTAPDSMAATSWLSNLLVNGDWWSPSAPLQHQGPVMAAAFSPDGRLVVTASADHTAQVWDTQSGRAVGPLLEHGDAVVSAAFSPDGLRVVTASKDRTARVWETGTAKPVGPPIQLQDSPVEATFSPDGQRVVTASDRTAQVWDVSTGKPVGSPMRHQDAIYSVTFSPDGRHVVTASADKTSKVWEAETGERAVSLLQHQGPVLYATFSPDGRRVVTASADHTAQVWETETGKPVGPPLRHQGILRTATFSPDGRHVVTASYDRTAQVWETETGKPVGPPLRHQGILRAAAFSPDGRHVVTASYDNTARVWDVETSKAIGPPLRHQGTVTSASFSPDGMRLVTASADKTARVWEAEISKPVGSPMQHQGLVRAVSISADGKWVVTASYDSTAQVWNAETGKPIGSPMQHGGPIYAVAFSPDGRNVVTASEDNTARLWQSATGKPLGSPMQHKGPVIAIAFSSDGRRVVTASADKTAQVWEVETSKSVGSPMPHQGIVRAAAFSPDGRHVATASSDHTARVWDAETGNAVGSPLQHDDAVNAVTFTPDGRLIFTASDDKTVRMWNAETGKLVNPPLQHQAPVVSVVPSFDGRRIVSASDDRTARVWDVETGKPVGLFMEHQGLVRSATFSPDGRRVITASSDHTARLWDAETGIPLGLPLEHGDTVNSAIFSPDGRRVITASDDKSARMWPVLLACCTSSKEADKLASLAEAVTGNEVTETSSLGVINGWERLQKLSHQSGTGPVTELSLDWMILRFARNKIATEGK